MKLDIIYTSSVLLTLLSTSYAYPGGTNGAFAKTIDEIKKRAAAPISGPLDSNELIGDLVTVGPKSDVAKAIADIIMGKADGQSLDAGYTAPGELTSAACTKDVCCKYKWAADDMAAAMRGPSGRCNAMARGCIRLGFHDAGAWAKGLAYGGADGSMVLTDEIDRSDNRGLEEAVNQLRLWYEKYKNTGATAADLVQLAANVATVVCPLGPRVRTFVGRKDNPKLPPEGLLPSPNDSADKLIQLFNDKTIKANGLVALLGSHTTSQQRFFKPESAFDPQDTTPGTWDVLYYSETAEPNAPGRVVRFPSDTNIANDDRTKAMWQSFTSPTQGQQKWNDFYAKEYVRLSLLGVNNINDLKECTKVLPPMTASFTPPDGDALTQWANGGFANYGQAIGQLLENGGILNNATLQGQGINPSDAGNKEPPKDGSPFSPKQPLPGSPGAPPSLPSGISLPPGITNLPRPTAAPTPAPPAETTKAPAAPPVVPVASPKVPAEAPIEGSKGGGPPAATQRPGRPEGFPDRPGASEGGIGRP